MNQEQQDLLRKANELLQAGAIEHAIEILSTTFGPDHSYVGIGYNALGARQYEAEDWQAARLSIQHARIIWEKHKGYESPEVGACANNLGRVCEHLGDYQQGVEFHREALAIRKTVLGEENVDTGMSYLSLGAALLSTQETEEAQECFEKGLGVYTALDLADSPEAKACISNAELCDRIVQNS